MQPAIRPQAASPIRDSLNLQPVAVPLLMLLTVAPVAVAFWFSPYLAMALVFVGMCIFLAQKRYAFFVLVAFLFFPFQFSLSGENVAGNFSASDAFMIIAFCALPLLFLSKRRFAVGPAGVPLLLFLSLSLVSSAFHWEGATTAVSLARMWVATLLPVLLFANADGKSAFAHRCFMLFLLGINVLSIGSLLAFAQGGVNASMSAMGNNKNLLGPMFGCGILAALTYLFTEKVSGRRRVWLLLTVAGASAGSLLSLSRGGWIATAAALLLLLLLLRKIKFFVISLVVLVPVLFIVWGMLPDTATDYASNVSSKSYTIQARLGTINQVMEAYEESPLIGVGVGLRKKLEPHNVLVLTLGEEGLLGLCGFIGMFIGGFATFAVAWRAVRRNPQAGRSDAEVEGSDPQTEHSDVQAQQIVLIGSCLLLLSLIAGMMDVYWRRGVGFLGWAGVGMAVNLLSSSGRSQRSTRALPRSAVPDRALREPQMGAGDVPAAEKRVDETAHPEGSADDAPSSEGASGP